MCTKQQFNDAIDKITTGVTEIMGDTLHSVLLYGSYARGDFNEESDIDIMILANVGSNELAPYRKRLNLLSSRTGLENDVMIAISLMDAQTVLTKCDAVPFYQNVLREGVNLLAG